jgi:hypothetical protein
VREKYCWLVADKPSEQGMQKKKQENGKSNQMISSQAGLFSFVHIVPRFK